MFNELNSIFIFENLRLRKTINRDGCAAVQCTSRVPHRTLAGFTPGLVWHAARLLVSCSHWLATCCQLGDNVLDSCTADLDRVTHNENIFPWLRVRCVRLHEKFFLWYLFLSQDNLCVSSWSTPCISTGCPPAGTTSYKLSEGNDGNGGSEMLIELLERFPPRRIGVARPFLICVPLNCSWAHHISLYNSTLRKSFKFIVCPEFSRFWRTRRSDNIVCL